MPHRPSQLTHAYDGWRRTLSASHRKQSRPHPLPLGLACKHLAASYIDSVRGPRRCSCWRIFNLISSFCWVLNSCGARTVLMNHTRESRSQKRVTKAGIQDTTLQCNFKNKLCELITAKAYCDYSLHWLMQYSIRL